MSCPIDYDLENCSSNEYGLTCETCCHWKNKNMFVKVEYILWLKEELRKINLVSLDKITWIENEKIVEVDSKVIEHFELSGLTNVDFITSGEYKRIIKE